MTAIDLGCQLDETGEPPWSELDDGIRETVRWLWRGGFHTSDSGDGRRLGIKADMEHVLDVPHVFMICAPDELVAEADRLARAVTARGLTGDAVAIEATYLPLGGVGVLQLFGVDDAALAVAPDDGANPALVRPTPPTPPTQQGDR